MKMQGLLLLKSTRRRNSGRAHDGKVTVDVLNQRWCSDGFEIACDNGEVVTGVFHEGLLRPRDHCLACLDRPRFAG